MQERKAEVKQLNPSGEITSLIPTKTLNCKQIFFSFKKAQKWNLLEKQSHKEIFNLKRRLFPQISAWGGSCTDVYSKGTLALKGN
jgi:hypothetical protein